MPRKAHSFSPQTLDATSVLGLEIARARRARQWTLEELAERAGVHRHTLRSVEHGSPTVAIGIVFEIATLLGIDLFGASPNELPDFRERGRARLALLPTRVRSSSADVDDDF